MTIALSIRVSAKILGQVVGLDGFQVYCESIFVPAHKNDFPLAISGKLLDCDKKAALQMRDDSAEIFFNTRRYKLASLSEEGSFQLWRDW